MTIIRSIMEDIKKYIGNNKRTDDARKEEALKALSLFMCPQITGNSSMQAVVGFDDNHEPQFWDMEDGNLLATCQTGVAMNYMGCTTILVSMLSRFTKEEFQYYLFTDEFSPNYLRRNEHCAGSAVLLFEERKDYECLLKKLFVELNYRNTLSETELKQLPFLLVVFGNVCRFFDDDEFESFRAMYSFLFRKGKRLRVACMVMSTRFEWEFLYHKYKDTFSGYVVGNTHLDTARELLKDNIPDWLIDGHRTNVFLFQNKKLRTKMRTYHLPLGIALQ